MTLKILRASLEQKPILANLLELYAYDFTKHCDFDIGDDGFYGYKYLPLYWSDENRLPYLVYVNEKIAGFVLVQKMECVDDTFIWDISEFFIMQKYKRKGIGQQVAKKIWRMLDGPWQVRVLTGNSIACLFWDKTIRQYAEQEPVVQIKIINNEEWKVYQFQ